MNNLKNESYGLLGKIGFNFYRFLETKKDKNLILFDPVNLEEVKSADYFIPGKGSFKFVLNPEHLPYEINVKGAYLSFSDFINFEFSQLDFERLQETINDNLRGEVELKGKSVYNFSGDKKIIKTLTANGILNKEYVRRTAVTLLPKFDSTRKDLALRVLDLIYDHNTFVDNPILKEKIDNLSSNYGSPKLKLEQNLELKQLMKQEQVPLLRPELNMYHALRSEILRMSARDLSDFVKNMPDKQFNGLVRSMDYDIYRTFKKDIDYRLVGNIMKVKKLSPDKAKLILEGMISERFGDN